MSSFQRRSDRLDLLPDGRRSLKKPHKPVEEFRMSESSSVVLADNPLGRKVMYPISKISGFDVYGQRDFSGVVTGILC